MKECLNYCIKPSDSTEINPMTQLSNHITRAQEYKANNKQPEPPMYATTDLHIPDDIIPPTYEVIMKSARQKKQEKYAKLASSAFRSTVKSPSVPYGVSNPKAPGFKSQGPGI